MAGIVVVVIVVAAAGGYLILGSSPHASSSTASETGTSAAAHPTTSTSSTSTSSTSSNSSPSTTTSASAALAFVIGSAPGTILMTPGSTVSYPVLTFTLMPGASSGSEMVALNSSAPPGLALTFSPNPVKLSAGTLHYFGAPDASALMKVNSSQSVTPGVYTITVVAKYGTNSTTYDLQVNVVKYLVTIPNNLEQFSPANLTVKQGSTVFWINLDKDNPYDVVFATGSSAQSGAIEPGGSFSYTFASAGTYSYSSSYNPLMTGTISVTANG